jgi:hypothetical protein
MRPKWPNHCKTNEFPLILNLCIPPFLFKLVFHHIPVELMATEDNKESLLRTLIVKYLPIVLLIKYLPLFGCHSFACSVNDNNPTELLLE